MDVLQKRGHIVGMTGDGVNDAPALKKGDCGIAVSGATDAARAAASIVLMKPGLSVIINAVKESRRIVQRMNSYAIYRIAETLRVLLFVTLAGSGPGSSLRRRSGSGRRLRGNRRGMLSPRTPAMSNKDGIAVVTLDEPKVPKGLRPVVEEIVGITDSVCLSVLDEEYADLARRAVAKLARKRPSPLQAGRRATWAAGVVYALGHVNFLSDPASEPCVTADQLSAAFGVAKSTMSSKARQVRDLLRISHFSPEFQRADVAAQNPLAWIIELNGLAVDARHVPPDIQAEAFQRGLIPYMPVLGPDETAARARSQVTGTAPVASAAAEVFPYAGGRLASPRPGAVASAAAPSEAAGLLDHCSDLKRQLVEFARSRRFSRQFDQALRAGSRGKAVDESEFINITDHFILQRPLPGGRTVVETFVSAHPELAEADRQMLLGWRDVVEGVFEIRERDGKAIIAVNLIDELTYRVYSNAGPVALASIHPPGA